MDRDKIYRLVLRAVAFLGILVGILSVFGVHPMRNRTAQILMGLSAILLGATLLTLRPRRDAAHPPTPTS